MSWFGYRNFDTPDNSVNNRVGAIPTFGEMLHNNHQVGIGKQLTTVNTGAK